MPLFNFLKDLLRNCFESLFSESVVMRKNICGADFRFLLLLSGYDGPKMALNAKMSNLDIFQTHC